MTSTETPIITSYNWRWITGGKTTGFDLELYSSDGTTHRAGPFPLSLPIAATAEAYVGLPFPTS